MANVETHEKFTGDLQGLADSLKVEIAAHDFKASVKKNENQWFMLAMKVCSALAMIVSGGAAYLTGDAATAFAWLGVIFGALNFGLTSWYDTWAPGEERSKHILAIGQKSSVMAKVNLQIMAPPEDRQDDVDFYRWIHESAADIENNTPYLPGPLLARIAAEQKKKS
jgi:hypothetical protein